MLTRRLRHILPLLVLAIGVSAASAESGYQTIQGTRVFTEIDHEAGVATFSNDCGRQKLTQSELQGGAIPTDIIPCPRDGGASAGDSSDDGTSEGEQAFRDGIHQKNLGDWSAAERAFSRATDAYEPLADAMKNRNKDLRERAMRQFELSMCLQHLAFLIDLYLPGSDRIDLSSIDNDPTCDPVSANYSLVGEFKAKLRAVVIANNEAFARREADRRQQSEEAAAKLQAERERPSDERCAVGIGTTRRVACVSPGEDCECLSFGNTCPYPVTITYQVDNFPTRSFELEGGKTDNGSACSTRSGQRVSYVRFRPWAGYPKPGQPQAEEKIEAGAQPEKAPVPKFAAYAANSEFGGGLGHGATEQEAVDEALRICRSNGSNTCVKRPTVTGDMSKVFATACCRVPRLGCVTAVGVSASDAALAAKDILKRAKFTECETSNSIRAGVR